MKSALVNRTSLISQLLLGSLLAVTALLVMVPSRAAAASGTCTPPSTDYGSVTLSISTQTAATYRVWVRMAASSSQNNTVLMQIGSGQYASCWKAGGSSVPVYASGATQHFKNDSSNWVGKDTGGAWMDISMGVGSHPLQIWGNADGVVVDRVILTQDTGCTPSGVGENCANPTDTTAPVVSITSPASGTTLSGATTVQASATDASGVTKVEFYVDGTLKSTDTTPDSNGKYSFSLDPSGLASGNHNLTAKAYDAANNSALSSVVTVNVAPATPPPTTYDRADLNQDGKVDILDVSLLSSKYNQSGSGLGRADINSDGIVNILDFSILASDYGK